MDFGEYISGIRFRLIKPHMGLPFPEEFYEKRLDRILKTGSVGFWERLGVRLEFFNTVLPEHDAETKQALWELCHIPKMSTLALGAIINRAVAQMQQDNAFVNVGIWHGFTFLCGMAENPGKTCIGIDNFALFGGPRKDFMARFELLGSTNHFFYDMDCFDYFAKAHRQPIGFYIYDGRHDYDSQLRGLQAAEPFFAPDCVILVDDTNWPEPRQATLDFVAASSNRYRILLDTTTRHNCHLTVWNGVMVLQRVTNSRPQPEKPDHEVTKTRRTQRTPIS